MAIPKWGVLVAIQKWHVLVAIQKWHVLVAICLLQDLANQLYQLASAFLL